MTPPETRVSLSVHPEPTGGWTVRVCVRGATAVLTMLSCSHATIDDAVLAWGGFVTDVAQADPVAVEVLLAVYDPASGEDPHELLNAIRASRR